MSRPHTPPDDALNFRSVAFNLEEWQQVRIAAHGRGLPVRTFIAEAIDAQLEPLLASLGADHVKVRRSHRRLPMSDRVLRRLSAGRDRAGMPAVAILRLVLARHARQPAVVPAAAS